jgi:serine phosphatase RsbU (regulator of sigma subunit)
MAVLLVLEGPDPGKLIPLDRDRTLLGRSSLCHIVLESSAVSREHSCILRIEGGFCIEDLNSRNGTLVNDQPVVGRRRLADRDRIQVCEFQFRFDGPTALPPTGEPSTISDHPEDQAKDSSTVEAAVSRDELLRKSHSTQRLRTLLELSARLSRSLDVEQILTLVVDNLFELYRQADHGFAFLEDERTGTFQPRMVRARRRVEEPTARFSRSLLRKCLETGQGLLSEDNSAVPQRATTTQSTVDLRVRWTMCVPLCAPGGRVFGALMLDTPDRLRKYTEDDLAFLMGVAQQTAIALENTRLHEAQVARDRMLRDLSLAQRVTRGFLPQELPTLPGYAFFADCEPALEVGGDYYDFLPLPPQTSLSPPGAEGAKSVPQPPGGEGGQRGQRLALLLGDIACKGVAAALLMAKLSSDVRLSLLTVPDLAAATARLNELLVGHVLQTDRFVTLIAIVLDSATHTLTLVSAGHPVPLLYRHATGTVENALPPDVVGIPLGVLDRVSYASHSLCLEPGDCLVAFTDGITEAMDAGGQLFRRRGIGAALTAGPAAAPEAGRRILQALKHHTAGQRQLDDLTMICLSREG